MDLYRSVTPFDKENLPAPLATFVEDETSYVDTTAEQGDQYFYLLKSSLGADSAFSREVSIKVTVDTGPGPQDLMWGDMFLGFFGIVPDYEVGVSLTEYYNTAPDSRYYKIYYMGRILYVGAPVVNTGKNANALIAAKIFNTGVKSYFGGSDGLGGAIRNISGRRFAPRIAKYFDYENDAIAPRAYSINFSDGMPFGRSEFIDLYRMMARSLVRATAAPFRMAHSAYGSTVPTITSDFDNVGRTAVEGFATVPLPATAGLGLGPVAMNAANNSFIPVVEYIGDAP